MKRLVCLLLAILICISIAGCSKSNDANQDKNGDKTSNDSNEPTKKKAKKNSKSDEVETEMKLTVQTGMKTYDKNGNCTSWVVYEYDPYGNIYGVQECDPETGEKIGEPDEMDSYNVSESDYLSINYFTKSEYHFELGEKGVVTGITWDNGKGSFEKVELSEEFAYVRTDNDGTTKTVQYLDDKGQILRVEYYALDENQTMKMQYYTELLPSSYCEQSGNLLEREVYISNNEHGAYYTLTMECEVSRDEYDRVIEERHILKERRYADGTVNNMFAGVDMTGKVYNTWNYYYTAEGVLKKVKETENGNTTDKVNTIVYTDGQKTESRTAVENRNDDGTLQAIVYGDTTNLYGSISFVKDDMIAAFIYNSQYNFNN